MIKLFKSKKPQILEKNAEKWTQEYLKAIDGEIPLTDAVSHRYNHPEIKRALEEETFGKCAYCESKLSHVSYGDVEHILPKSRNARPDLYVDWGNLTLSCEMCNRSGKGSYYNPQLLLVNPYKDNPEDYFFFLGPMISIRSAEPRAPETINVLDLNRAALVERRTERLQAVDRMFYNWFIAADENVKKVLADELKQECSPDKEYSAFVRSFLIAKGFSLA